SGEDAETFGRIGKGRREAAIGQAETLPRGFYNGDGPVHGGGRLDGGQSGWLDHLGSPCLRAAHGADRTDSRPGRAQCRSSAGSALRRERRGTPSSMRRHTLLIDADDTLWENNVFFEKLIEDFISIVEPYGYTRAYIRHILNETERKNIRQYGYGVRSFGRSL